MFLIAHSINLKLLPFPALSLASQPQRTICSSMKMPCHLIPIDLLNDWLMAGTLLAVPGMPFLPFKTQSDVASSFLNLPSGQSWSFCLQSFHCILYFSHRISHNHVTIIIWYYNYLFTWPSFLISCELFEGTDFHIHLYNASSWHTVGTKVIFFESMIQTHFPSTLDHWTPKKFFYIQCFLSQMYSVSYQWIDILEIQLGTRALPHLLKVTT